MSPGDRVTIKFIVTDATPIQEFYLLQRPSRLISWRSPAGSLLAANDRGDR